MGYSEVRCALCGVSFNLCRIRTPNEPREYAWNYHGSSRPGTTFIEVGDTYDVDTGCVPADCDYPGQEGCMVAFREDEAVQSRGRRGYMRRGKPDETWDELVFKGLEGERVDLEEDESDEDWVPGEDAEDEDGAVDFEVMECEFEGVQHGEREDAKMEDREDESCADEDAEYHVWIDKVMAGVHVGYGYPSDSNDVEKIRQFERMRCLAEEYSAKVPTEVKLPLHVPLESLKDQLRSEIEDGDHDECITTRDGKKLVSPILNHPLNRLGREDEVWEHLAGPDCHSDRGYHGSRISAEEMLNCNVAQGLLARDANKSWEIESTDDDWEGKGKPGWYLTGLVDQVGSLEDGDCNVYPDRHPDRILNGLMLSDVRYDVDDIPSTAMPFHPTCLEVFKRASLRRYGRFDIHALGNWWRASATYEYMADLSQDKEVKAGREELWLHHVGAEYLAANPFFVPSLEKVLESSWKAQASTTNTTSRTNLLSTSPVEIQRSIMSFLDLVDVASLSLACPGVRSVAQGVLQSSLLNEMPYLWELWSDSMPYSRWTGTTAAEIRAGTNTFNEQETEIARVLKILEEEDYKDECAQYRQYWDDIREERRKKSRIPLQEKHANFFDILTLDLVGLVLKLTKARTNGELKGLVNRERIWTDCNTILDRIEGLQEEGQIPPAL